MTEGFWNFVWCSSDVGACDPLCLPSEGNGSRSSNHRNPFEFGGPNAKVNKSSSCQLEGIEQVGFRWNTMIYSTIQLNPPFKNLNNCFWINTRKSQLNILARTFTKHTCGWQLKNLTHLGHLFEFYVERSFSCSLSSLSFDSSKDNDAAATGTLVYARVAWSFATTGLEEPKRLYENVVRVNDKYRFTG